MVLLYGRVDTPYRIMYLQGTPNDKKMLNKMGFIIGKNLTIMSKTPSYLIVNTDNKQIRVNNSMAEKVLLR